MLNISELTKEELEEYLEKAGHKKFHAKQIYKWIHKIGITNIDEMTDISKALREFLKEKTYILDLKILDVQKSKKDGTMKFLIELPDGNAVESVFMKYNHGNTACVSTQVGCKMGCKFCASTKAGFLRNLEASEIEGQIWTLQKYSGEKISNVVYMGIGEPLDNYDNSMKSIHLINDPMGLNIGARHISISTCGIVPKIYALADEKVQCTLSISLHATTNEKRKKIMPVANKWNLNELFDACKYYVSSTNRRISFEYALIASVNDSKEDAKELVALIHSKLPNSLAHVNLIPVNELKDGEYVKSKEKDIEAFMNIINISGIVATVRRELGSDIEAACGQLRRNHIDNENAK
ncbi:MAG: 23S rRNA (adenine(2503)-C(2))-methyltransferase RlmN [Clostridia bacterium]